MATIATAGRWNNRAGLRCTLVWVIVCALAMMAGARHPAIATELSRAEIAALWPEQDSEIDVGDFTGTPAAAPVRRGRALVGYAFSTRAVSGSLGYSGRPIDIVAILTTDGRIAGARLIAHEEPILVIGIPPTALETFVGGFSGLNIREPLTWRSTAVQRGVPDHVAGATVSSAVMKDAVLRSARAVAQSRGLLGSGTGAPGVDRVSFSEMGWSELESIGAIAQRTVRRGEVASDASQGSPDDLFVALYAALLTPPTIGQNLLGRRAFERLDGQLADGEYAILIAARGLYSIKGTQWRQTGVFDRLQIVQGSRTFTLHSDRHENVEKIAAEGAPALREIGIFRLPPGEGFDPTRPWRVEVLVDAQRGLLALDYTLPPQFVATSPPGLPAADASGAATKSDSTLRAEDQADGAIPELWEQIWAARWLDVALTVALLAILTIILFSHDLLVRNVRRYRIVRLSFLIATVVVLGFGIGAQLSVVHVATFAHALLSGFRWEQFLLDPPIFILWSFVALALLFWGRGVFCGWLCPFGALQELLNEVARRLGVRQFELPWPLHERLWPIKYVAFLLILGISLKSATQAFILAEIEPFKTVITLKLMREWQYVLYALVLLAAGLFIGRFYCRYLCPLGAALAIPARLRLFEWLKRRPQCGRECRICATRCMVQAINPLGQIVPNECIYCLQCQANYYDPATCPPLKRRAQRSAPVTPSVGAFIIREADDDSN